MAKRKQRVLARKKTASKRGKAPLPSRRPHVVKIIMLSSFAMPNVFCGNSFRL